MSNSSVDCVLITDEMFKEEYEMRGRLFVFLLIILMILTFALAGCGADEEEATVDKSENTSGPIAESEQNPEESLEEAEGIRPEFKELVEEYEALMDKYIEFMKTYDETDKSQEPAFNDIMDEYITINKSLIEWEKQGLTEDEQDFYDEVLERVGEKHLEANIAVG